MRMTNTIVHGKRYLGIARGKIILLILLQMLLLSGPPGLGKTTLAHVVARQAGYEVMEINARSVVPLALTKSISQQSRL
jgi:replication-associated recombination protein RarA